MRKRKHESIAQPHESNDPSRRQFLINCMGATAFVTLAMPALAEDHKHEDNMGHAAVMKAGDVQRISAGTGIAHSEFNNSRTEPVHFLQIWLFPAQVGLAPGYAQQSFGMNKIKFINDNEHET